MAAIIKAIIQLYHQIDENSDPRVVNYPLAKTPWPVFTIIAVYLYFVKSAGPRFMRDRPPYKLDGLMKIYNFVQILVCAWVFYVGLTTAWLRDYRWFGEPVDYSNSPKAIFITKATWVYFAVKIVDLFDTVFFILRKKTNQVTFLHVYHHAVMVFAGWLGIKFFAGGHATFLGTVNSFVHVVMYSYYLITSISPEYKKNIWWKKYITQLQMVQFLAITLQSLPVLFMKNPEYPRLICGLLVTQNSFMFVLFYDFYRKAYFKKKSHPS